MCILKFSFLHNTSHKHCPISLHYDHHYYFQPHFVDEEAKAQREDMSHLFALHCFLCAGHAGRVPATLQLTSDGQGSEHTGSPGPLVFCFPMLPPSQKVPRRPADVGGAQGGAHA